MRGRFVGAVLFLASATAFAQEHEDTLPGVEQHDGFYLHLDLGFGYTKMTTDDVGSFGEFTVSGSGGAFAIALGGAVTENLILYGELFDYVATNPTIEVGGVEEETTDVNAAVIGIGPGLAYYIMPANVYIAGTLAFAQLSIQQDGEEVAETDTGLGFNFMIGKEWWASDNWGLGIAAKLFFGSIPEKGDDTIKYSTSAFAIAFSATYN